MAKVLLVHHGCYIGGGGKGALTVSQMLREMGHEVVILNSTYKRDMFNCFNDNGFRCIEHKGLMGSIMHYSGGPNLFSRTFLTNLFNINATKNRIIEVISQENPDLVIVNSIVLAWLSIILRKLEIKSICFIRETPIKGIFTNITKVFLRKFSVLAFISEYDKDFYKLNNTKCIVIKDTIKFDIKEEYSDTIKKDDIISQFPSQGDYKKFFPGSVMQVIISKGKKPEEPKEKPKESSTTTSNSSSNTNSSQTRTDVTEPSTGETNESGGTNGISETE